MQINESRANSRGPLIAVIKIQIDTDQVDRIFLHQNDDEYRLAEQFQQKHNLNPAFIDHIYERIKIMSKQSQKRDVHKSNISNNEQTHRTLISDQNKKGYFNDVETTPFNKITNFTPIREQPVNTTPYHPKTQQNRSNYQHLYEIRPKIQEAAQNWKQVHPEKQLFHQFKNESKPDNCAPISLNTGTDKFKSRASESIGKIIEREKFINSIYQVEQTQKNDVSYSFNDETYANDSKPSKVKILTRDKLNSSSASLKKSMSKAEISRINKNVTNRLYNQSQIKKNYLNKIKERAKLPQQDEKDLEELTHRPKINKISQMIADNRYKGIPVEQYLLLEGKNKEAKIEKRVNKKAEKQLQNCSFKPQINQITNQLTRGRSLKNITQNSKYTEESRCSRHSFNKNQFRPSLNKVSEEIVKGKGNFDDRLKGYLEKKNQKLHTMLQQKKKNETHDRNGDKYFKPKIDPSSNRISSRTRDQKKVEAVHDHLYEMSKIKKEYPIEEAIPKINENSTAIVQQIHHKRLAYIFAELDNDQDGFISAKKISIDSIKQDVLEVIMPVLFEMQEMEIELNFSDFKKAIENLHSSLNTIQKGILYNYQGNGSQKIKINNQCK